MLSKYSEGLKNLEEHLSNAVIAAYINFKENLSEKEISFIENHISKCDDCRKRLNEMKEEDLEIDTDKELQNYKIARIQDYGRNKYYTWAAAVMIFIVLGIYFYFLPEKQVMVENNKLLSDSVTISENTQIVEAPPEKEEAKNIVKKYNQEDFVANNVLENFVDRNMRSEVGTKIISPAIGDTLSVPINFMWGNEKGNYTFELVNNRNKRISRKVLSNNHLVYNEKLNPGLYYWEILVNDKLEAVGKFYIK